MKYNKTRTVTKSKSRQSYKNFEGGESFTSDPKMELYKMTCATLFGEPKFYEGNQKKADSSSNRIIQLAHEVAETDPEFILKLAYYARTQMHLRTTPTVLLFEAGIDDNMKRFVRRWTPHIINRVDEMAEVIAMFTNTIDHIGDLSAEGSLPAALKKGIADTLSSGKFRKYQLAKYTNENAEGKVKLKDVIKIVHPKPQDKHMSQMFRDILNGELKQVNTWNAVVSKEGSNEHSWLKAMGSAPIFATVRNLRNILDNTEDPDMIQEVVNKLTNPEIIKNSRLLPFRFLSAYNAIQNHRNKYAQTFMDALEESVDLAIDNIIPLPGTTAVLVDVSGSMTERPLSDKSDMYPKDIATLFGAMAHRVCQFSHLIRFASDAELIRCSRRNGAISNAREIANANIGSGTVTSNALRLLINRNEKVDRIITFTDAIGYTNSWQDSQLVDVLIKYRDKINPRCRYYEVDLMGYGNAQVPDTDPLTCLISGWSEKIFEYIPLHEHTGRGPIEQIERITLPKK